MVLRSCRFRPQRSTAINDLPRHLPGQLGTYQGSNGTYLRTYITTNLTDFR